MLCAGIECRAQRASDGDGDGDGKEREGERRGENERGTPSERTRLLHTHTQIHIQPEANARDWEVRAFTQAGGRNSFLVRRSRVVLLRRHRVHSNTLILE